MSKQLINQLGEGGTLTFISVKRFGDYRPNTIGTEVRFGETFTAQDGVGGLRGAQAVEGHLTHGEDFPDEHGSCPDVAGKGVAPIEKNFGSGPPDGDLSRRFGEETPRCIRSSA